MPFHLCWGHLCVSGCLCVQTKASDVRSVLQLYLSLNFLFVQGLKVTKRWKIGALLDIFWTNSQPCICMWVSCSLGKYQSFQSSLWNLSLQLSFLHLRQSLGRRESDTTEQLHFIHFILYHWRRKWQLTPVFLLGESRGQRSLACHGPQAHRESDMTEVTKHTLVCPDWYLNSGKCHVKQLLMIIF